ncbi:MAG TPA: TlpA disulfide reductase family protein [Dehalococcoidia bacterium]|nr:TlpA disulfide reductase family protein [Dehalococcoidia bacterium]
MNLLRWHVLLLSLALLALLPACGGAAGAPGLASAKAGQPAGDFQVALFSGGEFRLADAAGREAVVVNFWFPSCPPCRAEMPEFQSAWEQLEGQPVRFLGLFVPQGLDTEQDAKNFVAELGLTYDFGTDRGAQVAQSYQLQYFPTTYFIGKDGRVFRVEVSTLDAPAITRLVREMLGS